jgi:type II secretory pathway component PulJ
MNARRALTLVETIVAIALMVLLGAALSGFLWDLQRQRDVLADLADDRLAAQMLFDELTHDLAFAVTSAEGRAGLIGDERSLTVRSRRIAPVSLDAAAALRDLRTLAVTFDEEQSTLTLAQQPGASAGPASALSERIRRLRLRYHDGATWTSSWNAAASGELPAAVEIALWFHPPGRPRRLQVQDDELGPLGRVPEELAELSSPESFLRGDESAWAAEGSLDKVVWPEPDRLRVIAIPMLRRE